MQQLGVRHRIDGCKAALRQAIVNGHEELPLNTFMKHFDFKEFKYCNRVHKRMQLNFNSISCLTRMLEIMEISLCLIQKGEMITKRNLYYKLIHYYKRYIQVDEDIDLVAFNLSITREDLHIVSSSRCLLFGSVSLQLDANLLVCSPRIITNISAFKVIGTSQTQCRNLIIIQKQSALYQIHQLLMRLAKGNVEELPEWLRQTIFISAKGYPDTTCRAVIDSLQRAVPNLLYLGDEDIYGVDILLCYAIGYNNFETIVHNMKWIQLNQLVNQAEIEQDYLPLSKEDRIKYKQIMGRQYFKELEGFQGMDQRQMGCKQKMLKWQKKLQQIYQSNKKMQLQSYFKYLPDDWVQQVIGDFAVL